jgi:hypothetical protein
LYFVQLKVVGVFVRFRAPLFCCTETVALPALIGLVTLELALTNQYSQQIHNLYPRAVNADAGLVVNVANII